MNAALGPRLRNSRHFIQQYGLLTQRDAKAAKLTKKYLIDDGKHTWRATTPDLVVEAQPDRLDMMQRELLDGTVNLDPYPSQRNTLRTKDIQDPAQATAFMRAQISKHLEHYFASKGKPALAAKLSTKISSRRQTSARRAFRSW